MLVACNAAACSGDRKFEGLQLPADEIEKRYNVLMDTPEEHKQDSLLNAVSYFTLISIAISALLSLPKTASPWLILLNFVLIAVLMSFNARCKTLRQSVIYLSLFTLLGTAFFFLGVNPGIYQILFFIISAQAMMMLPTWGGLLWLTLLAVITGTAFWILDGLEEGLLNILVYSSGYLFFGIFGRTLMNAKEATRRSDELLSELQQAHQQLQDNVLQLEHLAVAKERNRLSREMHDALGHRLTVSTVQLEGAQRLISDDPERSEEMITTAREQVLEALADLRKTVATLREPLETGLEFQQGLKSLIEDFEGATDLNVNLLVCENFPRLPDSHRLTFYRTVQEALTNVQRHANAKNVWVQLDSSSNLVELTVEDDGEGFIQGGEPGKRTEDLGFGLSGMRERAAQLGGECFFESRPGGGAQISISLPLEIDSNDS